MKIIKNILLVAMVLVVAYFTAEWFGAFYSRLFSIEQPHGLGAFFGSEDLVNLSDGLIPAFVTYLTLLLTAFGDKHKYWWMGILLLPVFWFVIKFDLVHWYFYLVLAVIGWLVGWGITKFRKV